MPWVGWDFETDPPDTIQDKTPRKKLVWELPEVSLRGQAQSAKPKAVAWSPEINSKPIK